MNRSAFVLLFLALLSLTATSLQAHENEETTFKTPSESMLPNIRPDVPVDGIKLKNPSKTQVQRGDVVIFESPEGSIYMKRVIAIGGDKIKFLKGKVFLNGKQLKYEEVKELGFTDLDKYLDDYLAFRETVGSKSYFIFLKKNAEPIDLNKEISVPVGSIFVLSDNRKDWTGDSRGFGPVPLRNVRGKLKD